MNERETERRLLDWLDAQASPAAPEGLRRSVAAIPMTVPVNVGDRLAAAHGLRRVTPIPALAWVLLLAGLLLAVVAGGLVVGGMRLDRLVAVPPAPVPALTILDEAADILATTRAKPLPAQATCPQGSNSDGPGPAAQDRPSADDVAWQGPLAFDRHAGRLVLLAADERDPYGRASQTWTYDVCANAWQRMHPAEEPGRADNGRLVYDADSDRTLLFTNVSGEGARTTDGEIWSYDPAADHWTRLGAYTWAGDTEVYGTIFYHDPSGLVVAYDGVTMWSYDVDTNAMAAVRQQPDPSLPPGAALPAGKIALGYDRDHDRVVAVVVPGGGRFATPYGRGPGPADTWTFDPATGSWRREAAKAEASLIVCWGPMPGMTSPDICHPTNGRAVFDEASGSMVFMTNAAFQTKTVDAFDAASRTWRTLTTGLDASSGCSSMPPVYDPLNGRIVCLSGGPDQGTPGVSAFSTTTGQWRWLLEPSDTPPPAPTLTPGATPIDWGTPPPGWEPPPVAEPSANPVGPEPAPATVP